MRAERYGYYEPINGLYEEIVERHEPLEELNTFEGTSLHTSMRLDLQRESGGNAMGQLEEERDVVTDSNGPGGGLDAVGKIERDERNTNGQALRSKGGSNLYGQRRKTGERQHQEREILRSPRHHDVIRMCQLSRKYEETPVWHGRTTTVRHRVRCLSGPHVTRADHYVSERMIG